MTTDVLPRSSASIDKAQTHALLRFSTGVTIGFILAEIMGWAPTFLVPVLTAVLLANLPFSPPLKVGILLVAVMTLAATLAFVLSSSLLGSPAVLVGCISVLVFLAFLGMARGMSALPPTLFLLSLATVPVVAMATPAYADLLPIALVRGMAVSMAIVWGVHAVWPEVAPPSAKPASIPVSSPVRTALIGTAIVMPMMLIYLLFGLADALPVLVTTVLLVATFNPRLGAVQGFSMVLGNLFGGFIGLITFLLLGITPSLPVLALLTFLIGAISASGLARGGATGAIALLICNSSLIILSTALANPDSSAGIWLTRLLQFCLAGVFAVAMLSLAWPSRRSADGARDHSQAG